ncbi:E3 SUMO-protein ligase ZNF451 isoform X6 [Corapipo altera]|uniref:E3 SUMO-protein ligase ZNF451 isoform X6 n=1 Tax=Corapipo altera TaxID=415028 RepID=UPI000FD68F29|nr:E3 SUMO-protein ligase ZNF451 isoform X6 [Corapipo altera]
MDIVYLDFTSARGTTSRKILTKDLCRCLGWIEPPGDRLGTGRLGTHRQADGRFSRLPSLPLPAPMAALPPPPPPEAAWRFPPSEQELDGAQLKIMESHSSVSLHRSKSPASESEDEIEFVGEGPLRPILECIDLVSSEDEEPNSSSYVHRPSKRKDHVDYQKERVASTLDRLARHVEVEKQQKEEKNKAFKEKVDSQYAHGLQELEFIREHSDTEAARLCVDQWLKMPGLKPGSVNGGKRGACKRAAQTQVNSSPKHCPVMHCNREFDNVHLLLGHLQRFDHSPCDPTVTLRGPPNNAVACVICCERFSTSQQYSDHLLSKLNENDGHKKGLPPQHIQCFACPNCFLLFTKSEECLQHMSGKKHFLQVSQLNDEMKTGHPLPFPTYAKNLLISLCKEVPFQVKCISCCKILRSHMELTAHFRMRCHNSGPVALSKKSISQVAEIFKTKGEDKDCISSPMEVSPERSPIAGKWQCRICEEMFESEESVKQHCMSLESHAFHRYSCGLCRNHFRKVGTLERHFQEHHNQETQTKYFCGLCGHLFFDTEEEFLIHYTEIHGTDYTFVPEQMEVSIKKEEDFLPVEQGDLLTCGCRTTYVSKINRKNDYENCQKAMLEKGNLWFRCCLCSATAQNIADLKNHLKSHTSLKPKGEMYVVRCAACNKNFNDLPSAHQHYHMKHCFLQKPDISSLASESENTVFKFTASGACQVRKPHRLQFQASPSKTQDRPQLSPLQRPIEQRKENNEDSAHAEELSENGDLPDLDYLSTMTHIVLVDLDNWGSFFTQLPANLNQGTFIWGFQGGYSNWKPPVQCKIYNYLKRIGCFFLHPRCGTRREAADFALCVHAGRLDEHLPKQIPFTVLSGDKSFLELENQFKMTQRSACILNPHHIEGDMMCALLNSISDTTKGSDSEEDEDMKLTVKRNLEEIKNQEAFLPRVTSQNVEQDVELQEAIKRSLEEM